MLSIVIADPAVESIASFVSGSGSSTVNNGRMFITLKPTATSAMPAPTRSSPGLRQEAAGLPGITLFMQASQDIRVGGRMSKAQYQYALQSTDLNELKYWSALLLDKLRKNRAPARCHQRPAHRRPASQRGGGPRRRLASRRVARRH